MKRIVVTPAGRKRYLEILFEYVSREKNNGGFDFWHLWVNTNNHEDMEYCKMLSHQNLWIKTVEFPDTDCASRYNIYKYYKYACDEDTVYVKIDDDIVFMENGFINKLFKFRLENPQYFLVYPNIINNPITSFIHYRKNLIKSNKIPTYNHMCNIGWKDDVFAEELHRRFLADIYNNDFKKWSSFDEWRLCPQEKERMPINCISWMGVDFKEFDGKVAVDDNQFLSMDKPVQLGKENIIFGDAIAVHFAFYTHRDHLESTNILKSYKDLSVNVNHYMYE